MLPIIFRYIKIIKCSRLVKFINGVLRLDGIENEKNFNKYLHINLMEYANSFSYDLFIHIKYKEIIYMCC